MNRIVFLDRDGVFNRHIHPGVLRESQLEWLPGIAQAMRELKDAGFRTSLATNQPWIGIGLLSRKRLARMHGLLQAELATTAAPLDHIEYAPGPGRRRKPQPGMLERGAKALGGCDKTHSWMVGDKWRDVEAGQRFGVRPILLCTTKPRSHWESSDHDLTGVHLADDLPDAVKHILEWTSSNGS